MLPNYEIKSSSFNDYCNCKAWHRDSISELLCTNVSSTNHILTSDCIKII